MPAMSWMCSSRACFLQQLNDPFSSCRCVTARDADIYGSGGEPRRDSHRGQLGGLSVLHSPASYRRQPSHHRARGAG